MIENMEEFQGLTCTINTTEDCNLRCKYCYETAKKPKVMDLDKCYKFIDLVLSDDDFCHLKDTEDDWIYRGRIFDFIGGDALMNVDILEPIMKYIATRWALLKNKPIYGWRGSISTNGTLFGRPAVREFCEKWKDNLHVGVSLDGCPEIHDKNRVFPDGSGSMDKILEWWPWYRKVFPQASLQTKATCARDTIPYLRESLEFLHEIMGLKYINQNFIMEDTGCTEEDYKLLDKQLELCTEYVLQHCDEMHWTMIDESKVPEIFKDDKEPTKGRFYTHGWCGSGCMPALSIDGNIYPCFRWLPHTQNGQSGVMCVGNVEEGFINSENFRRVSEGAYRVNCTREQKCLECEFEPCCPYCIGGCYAEKGDFIRSTYICEITKLQCKWARIYWKEYCKLKGLKFGERIYG